MANVDTPTRYKSMQAVLSGPAPDENPTSRPMPAFGSKPSREAGEPVFVEIGAEAKTCMNLVE